MGESASLRFGVIVPCRNEAEVVARRIRNLARLDWPASDVPHRVLVVDDGSTDRTAERARAAIDDLGDVAGLAFEVVTNPGPHGKLQAMGLAIEALDDVDLLLLTDADVVFRADTPRALRDAFARDPRLAMASGAQEFVDALADDGSCERPDGDAPRASGERYDLLTAWVRRIESNSGRLFSVHGQCLCWRRDLELRPSAGFAADDLDLRQQVRARGGRIALVGGARFLEIKIDDHATRESQALRRAEAYFQFVRRTPHGAGSGLLDRLHWSAYRFLPEWFPALRWVTVLVLGGLGVAVVVGLGVPRGLEPLVVLPLATTIAWFLLVTRRIDGWIRRASRAERAAGLTDSWETAR